MAVSKCVKCGANIPGGAGFCPACGAPKAAEPVPQPAPVAPASQPVSGGPSSFLGIFNTLFSELITFVMILLGLLFACIGGIMLVFAGDLTVLRIGIILNSLGFVFMGTFLLMGGLVNKGFDNYVRFGMIVGGAIMLTWPLSWAA